MRTFLYRFCLLTAFILLSPSPYYSQTKIADIINRVNIDSLTLFVKQLSGVEPVVVNGTSQLITTRHYQKPGKDIAGQWIKDKFESFGLTAKIDTITSGNYVSGTGKNILAIKTGSKYPLKKYVICAHYDSMPQQEPAPGADDNGSGTATVIEAARVLAKENNAYTIVFAAFDEEEYDLCGSSHYVLQSIAAGETIMGVINLDMIAYDSNNDNVAEIHTRPVGTSVEMANTMVDINTKNKIGLVLSIINPGVSNIDSYSFWAKKATTITLIESDGDFNPYYHNTKPYDDITHFNWNYFSRMAKTAAATLAFYSLDSMNAPPVVNFVRSTPNPALIGQPVKMSFRAADPDEDSVRIMINWGDNEYTDYGSYFANNTEEEFSHTFSAPGTYIIEEQAEDVHGVESDWIKADTIYVKDPNFIFEDRLAVNDFRIYNNYPNPFNPATTITFNLPLQCTVNIQVLNPLGQIVKQADLGCRQAGYNKYWFDAGSLSSGVYFYSITANSYNGKIYTGKGKMILSK